MVLVFGLCRACCYCYIFCTFSSIRTTSSLLTHEYVEYWCSVPFTLLHARFFKIQVLLFNNKSIRFFKKKTKISFLFYHIEHTQTPILIITHSKSIEKKKKIKIDKQIVTQCLWICFCQSFFARFLCVVFLYKK